MALIFFSFLYGLQYSLVPNSIEPIILNKVLYTSVFLYLLFMYLFFQMLMEHDKKSLSTESLEVLHRFTSHPWLTRTLPYTTLIAVVCVAILPIELAIALAFAMASWFQILILIDIMLLVYSGFLIYWFLLCGMLCQLLATAITIQYLLGSYSNFAFSNWAIVIGSTMQVLMTVSMIFVKSYKDRLTHMGHTSFSFLTIR